MSLLTAAQHAANRLKVFREMSERAKIAGRNMKPEEFWEPEDQAVLDALETEIRLANGERPLMEIA